MHSLATVYDDYSDVGYSSDYSSSLSPGVILFAFLFGVAIYAVSSWLTAKIFEKAGVAGWKAWVPLYNSVVLLKMGGQSPWWLLVAFIPFIGIVGSVFMIIAIHNVNVGFGRGAGSTVLYIFLPFIWMLMLALGGDRWQGGRIQA